jgi:hypothetical protein
MKFLSRFHGTSLTPSIVQQQQQQTVSSTSIDDPSRLAVEKLIASIKSKQLQEAQRKSDRKIVDIIHRVLGRTIDLVYDEDEDDQVRKTIEHESELVEQTSNSVDVLDENTRPMISHEVTSNDDHVQQPHADQDNDDDDDDDDDDEDEDDDNDEQKENIEHDDSSERFDVEQNTAYRRILLGISNEELLHVRGTHIDVSTPTHTRNRARSSKQLTTTEQDRSVHRFCIEMFDYNDRMPRELRAITQLYHQRARFRHQLPLTSTYYEHGQLPNSSDDKTIENDDSQWKM